MVSSSVLLLLHKIDQNVSRLLLVRIVEGVGKTSEINYNNQDVN